MKTLRPAENTFEVIYADITHKCNMNCSNCYLPARTIPDMDLKKFEKTISALPGPCEIRLIGGEPTINPQLFDFVRIINRYEKRSVLVTNGLRLSDFNFAKKLKQAGLNFISISLSGFDENQIYLKTDQMACADLKMQALKNIDKLGFEIGIGCLVVKGVNEHIVKKIIHSVPNYKSVQRINVRNIGKIGRFISDKEKHLKMLDLVNLLSDATGISKKNILRFQKSDHQIYFRYKTNDQVLRIKITDWQPMSSLIPDPDSLTRGRITQEYKIAQFFEHVKMNEFGY